MNIEDIRQLVQGRIEQATESLADAKTLFAAGRGGRSIVNRSYYAMFYCVLALLQTINKTPRKHQGAISLFDREFIGEKLSVTVVIGYLLLSFLSKELIFFRKR